jgi:hypothetical protein
MNNFRRVGIRAIPDDADVAKFLFSLSEEYETKIKEVYEQMDDTIDQTIRSKEPPIFAFGKLLNYLASLEKPELVELLAGSIWKEKW